MVSLIDIDDFAKVELRVAQVTANQFPRRISC